MDETSDISEEIKAILESYGIKDATRLNSLDLKSTMIDCPKCDGKARVSFDPDNVAAKIPGTGIANIIVHLPCDHCFVASVDKDFKVRGMLEIEMDIHISTERIDIRYLREKIRALEELHARLKEEKNQNLQYKVFTEIARLRKAMERIK
jgi:hypothetical protein